jgi:hypothetical protein
MVVFSFFSGADLYHKVALLNVLTRDELARSGLLDQIKILTMRSLPKSYQLRYAFELADVIHLVATSSSIQQVNAIADMIDLKNHHSEKQTYVDLTVVDLNKEETDQLFSKELDDSLVVRKVTARESSSTYLLHRLVPAHFSSEDNKYFNAHSSITEENDRIHEEYIRCSLKPNSVLWQAQHPNCTTLRLEDSPDMLKVIQFPSLA